MLTDLETPMPNDDVGSLPPAQWPEAPGRVAVTAGAGLLLTTLAACGGGEGQAGLASGSVETKALAATVAGPSAADAGRFLSQATLGYSRADLNTLMASNYSDWITAQFNAPTSQGHCDWLKANGYADASHINNTTGLDNTLWRKFISSGDPLRQRLVLALSEICVVSVLGINAQWRQFSVGHYLDLLEANAFGNYRQLLQDITLSPAMAYYLTYRGNLKANPSTGSEPDENYARELMQLFTIGLLQLNADGSVKTGSHGAGLETYQQADVSGLARVFTGWNVDVAGLTAPYPPDYQMRPLVNHASNYETGSKSFLGTTIAAGTQALDALNTALDTLFNHPNLPPFIGRQLIQRLVTRQPECGLCVAGGRCLRQQRGGRSG